MKAGRNDPCPCGSGKKFKKCCLRKEQAEEAVRVAQEEARQRVALAGAEDTTRASRFVPPPPPPPEPEPDPVAEAMNAVWKEFEEKDFEGKIALFEKTLEDEELMDDEMAFEMLNQIHSQAAAYGEWHRFRDLVSALQQRLPEVYDANAPYILPWLISRALATGSDEELTCPAMAMAGLAGDHMDEFIGVIDQLAYHGRLTLLVEMTRAAWPGVKDSEEVLAWAVSDFAERAAAYEIFHSLEQGVVPDVSDQAFLDRLRFFYTELDGAHLRDFLDNLTGKNQRNWTPEDFNLQPRPKKRRRGEWGNDYEESKTPAVELPGRKNLADLGTQFVGYLSREEGVPFTRARMGRQYIVEYLVERVDGKLQARESMIDALMPPGRRKPMPKDPKPLHLLCPDRTTLDRYLAGMLSLFSYRIYDVAATMELIPAWLRFLEARQLITGEQHQQTLEGVRPLVPELSKLFANDPEDPRYGQVLRSWSQGTTEQDPTDRGTA